MRYLAAQTSAAAAQLRILPPPAAALCFTRGIADKAATD